MNAISDAQGHEGSHPKRHAGQAWHVLSGFRYQLLQALDSWLRLQAGETLWLEADEDFSIESRSLLTAAQVKSSVAARGPASFSLRSNGVSAALSRHWARSEQGNKSGTQLVFIANGSIGHERDFVFPDGTAGLEYWTKAAGDADTAPLRAALAAYSATLTLYNVLRFWNCGNSRRSHGLPGGGRSPSKPVCGLEIPMTWEKCGKIARIHPKNCDRWRKYSPFFS